MSKFRSLRRRFWDETLFDRLVAGESVRSVARAYGVPHTTLSRQLRRPEAKHEWREARCRLQVKRKAEKAEEQRRVQEVRTQAQEDGKFDREVGAWERRRPRRSGYAGWLDERDGPRGLPSRDRFSESDHLAERAVAAGGGLEQIIDATGLDRANALRNIDHQILVGALANDAKFPANARPDNSRLRWLDPDSELIRRRASRETLRSLAADYGVSHTTLSRYFRREAVAKQVSRQRRAVGRAAIRRAGGSVVGSAQPGSAT